MKSPRDVNRELLVGLGIDTQKTPVVAVNIRLRARSFPRVTIMSQLDDAGKFVQAVEQFVLVPADRVKP
jgi:hypothetical protein